MPGIRAVDHVSLKALKIDAVSGTHTFSQGAFYIDDKIGGGDGAFRDGLDLHSHFSSVIVASSQNFYPS